MNRTEAFAHHGILQINRRKWHDSSDDGVQVVSIWSHNIQGDTAEAHVHAKDIGKFPIGTKVRAVKQKGVLDRASGNMVCLEASPSSHDWIVRGVHTRLLDRKHIHVLHVLELERL